MNNWILFGLICLISQNGWTQSIPEYQPLDRSDPIIWKGDKIEFKGNTIALGPKAFFIDGQLLDSTIKNYPYVFNSINEAAKHLTDGTEVEPMILYIAPYVYWIDDPDDPEVRQEPDGSVPYGLIIDCDWLKFIGLTKDPENVVLACNRGQTIGSIGNFTMFKFIGDGTGSENITFGNYCNVNLDFPLKPELNRPQRASAIVQAQLIHCNGDKIVARNTRFISRLNLCPFVGGKRVLFDRCHFESTDDALCGTGVYLDCTFDFYSSKPFYWTRGTGAVFMNCDIHSFPESVQYFTKVNGQVALINTRITSDHNPYLSWRDIPPLEMRNYQYQITLNDQPVIISSKTAYATVDLNHKPLLNAYLIKQNSKVIYNTYNLLKGDDDWDPMHIKNEVIEAEKNKGIQYTNLPVQLKLSPTRKVLETGKDSVKLIAELFRFGNYPSVIKEIDWQVNTMSEDLVKLETSQDFSTCKIIPTNQGDTTRQVIILASTPDGLEAASVLTIAPARLEPPKFITPPRLSTPANGKLKASYQLDTKYSDESVITWFRCSDADGNNAIETEVSRNNEPLKEYVLTAGDEGYYIKAEVAPKHLRSDTGPVQSAITKKPVSKSDITADPYHLKTDFRNMSVKNQEKIIPGFWTMKHFDPEDMSHLYVIDTKSDAWYYGDGKNGAAGMQGLLQKDRSASLFYTPVFNECGDMKVILKVSPFKSAGQGFSVAHLYMDIVIKFNAQTMSGYGLRFIRTTKHGNAVDCYVVKYQNGKVIQLTDPVTTRNFKSVCTIEMEVKGNYLAAKVSSTADFEPDPENPEIVGDFTIKCKIEPDESGGFGIQYNGGEHTMINEVELQWRP